VRIHYFSDIHLEFGPLKLPDVDADVIVAAGDIGLGVQGFEWLARLQRPVVYVAGNHEFYQQDHGGLVTRLEKRSREGGVRFLENRSIILDNVRFLGCTLWTDLGAGEEDVSHLESTVNDFHKICYNGGPYRLHHYQELHRRSRDWLEQSLQTPFSGPTIVVTHHAPTFWSWDNRPSALNRFAYCNDLRGLMYEYDIAAWFHGHTHVVRDYRCADTRILCNPRGYHGKNTVREFLPDRVAEV